MWERLDAIADSSSDPFSNASTGIARRCSLIAVDQSIWAWRRTTCVPRTRAEIALRMSQQRCGCRLNTMYHTRRQCWECGNSDVDVGGIHVPCVFSHAGDSYCGRFMSRLHTCWVGSLRIKIWLLLFYGEIPLSLVRLSRNWNAIISRLSQLSLSLKIQLLFPGKRADRQAFTTKRALFSHCVKSNILLRSSDNAA